MYEDSTLSTDAFLGWVIAVVMAACGWLLAAWPIWEIGEAGQQALAAFPERIGSWSDDGGSAMIGLFLPVLPLLILPGAFGSTLTILGVLPGAARTPLISNQPWRVRCALVGGLAGLTLLGALETRAALGHRLGVAEATGVTWLKDGQAVERRPWTEAKRIDTGCRMIGRRSPDPRANYQVAFDGHPPADLSPVANERLADWMTRIAPLDAQLRAAGVPSRAGDLDGLCLERLGADLTPAETGAFRALLNAP